MCRLAIGGQQLSRPNVCLATCRSSMIGVRSDDHGTLRTVMQRFAAVRVRYGPVCMNGAALCAYALTVQSFMIVLLGSI